MALGRKRDGKSAGDRPPLEHLYIYGFLGALAYMISDISILLVREKILPDPTTFVRPQARIAQERQKDTDFRSISDKNLFNRKGLVPPALGSDPNANPEDNAAPVLTQLPLELIGTIVHVDESRSIATINLKGQNKIVPVAKGDDMAGFGTAEKVERGKLIFRNSSSNRLEYVELAKEGELKFGTNSVAATSKTSGVVTATSETEFSVKRSTLDGFKNNLDQVLQQAVTVPVTNPDGSIAGFKLQDFQPGSIFEQLGLRRGDVIKGANNERVDGPAAAMRMFRELSNAQALSVEISRDGRDMSLNYNITQ